MAEFTEERLRDDVLTVAGFIVGWWPGLEDGLHWPQTVEDEEIFIAAQRLILWAQDGKP